MTVKAAAERLDVSPSLVYALCRLGRIEHTRHGRPGKRGTLRITEEALQAYRETCNSEVKPLTPQTSR